ncbi:MAG: TetR/AcrR family transcriptional regulator [Sphingosinicella sp.]|nr:TetR/AcrR family transcriptional regulator [Sphingosinicella sp.]
MAASRLLGVFREHGYDGASLAELSKATGLGRSSLYHHFPGGKEDMAKAVFDHIHEWMEISALAPLREPGDPAERLQKMINAIDRYYVGGYERCLLGSFVLGGSRGRFQPQLKSSFSGLIKALAALAVEAGASQEQGFERAEEAVVQIQGSLVVSGGLDDPAPFRRVMERLPRLILGRS